MQNELNNKVCGHSDQEMIDEAFRVLHQILKNAEAGDKKAKMTVKKNRAFYLQMQNDYEEFKHYKI